MLGGANLTGTLALSSDGSRLPEEQLVVDPEISDKDLDLVLHKHLADIESKLLSDGHDVMHPQPHESFPTAMPAWMITSSEPRTSNDRTLQTMSRIGE